MDKLEYIPGDLVMTNGVPCGTAKDVVYRVTLSDPSRTFEFDDGTELKGVVRLENLEGVEFGDKGFLFGDCCAWVKDIVPIPLTPEILEKNGWKKEVMSRGVKNSHCVYTKPDIKEYGYFPIYIEKGIGDEFDVYPFTGNNVCTQIAYIKYVHQLQHLLYGLGINHKMWVQKDVIIVNNERFKTDYPIGAIICIEGTNCKVVEDIDFSDENCYECILNNKKEGIMCRNLACLNHEREDRKDVHFEKIESHE